MEAQVVYERDASYDLHVGPYGYEKVGVLIDERVIWLSCTGWGSLTSIEEYEKWETVAKKIVAALNEEVNHE